jgi:hypothetical protein
MRSSRLAAGLALVGMAQLPVGLAARLPGEYMHEYATSYQTPHIPWAKPWAQGKLRVFFITPFSGAAREVTEVWQRADIDLYGETTASSTELGRSTGCFPDVQDTSPEEKGARLLRKLSEQRYDVFVVGNFNWSAFPPQVQYALLEQVAAGAGLVIVHPRQVRPEILHHPDAANREWILAGIPLQAIPFFAQQGAPAAAAEAAQAVGERLLKTYRAGKGRVAVIDYGQDRAVQPCSGGLSLTPWEDFDFQKPTYYEYYMALVIRAILWAAGKVPPVRLTDLPSAPLTVRVGEATELAVGVQGPPPPAGLTLRWRLKNCWGEEEGSGAVAVGVDGLRGRINLRLPALPGGRHFCDLFLDSARGREDFAALALQAVGVASVAELEAEEDTQPPYGGGVRGRVTPGASELRIELRDNYGRLFYLPPATQRPQPQADGRFRWRIPPEALRRAVSSCVRVRVQVLAGGQVCDQQEAIVTVPRSLDEEYPACMWGMMPGYVGHLAARRLRELGFNIVLGGSTAQNARALAVEDLKNIPYCTRLASREHFVNAHTLRQTCEQLTQLGRELARYHPHVYSLGDENFVPSDLGYAPEDQPWLRQYLQQRYPSLETLNRAWGTEFSSWEQVRPLSREEARARGKLTAWHDLLCFREELYAQRHHQYADALRAGDPHARVGAEGSQEQDLELTLAARHNSPPLDFWGPYRDLRYNTLLRSLAPRDLVRGNWFGGYRSQRQDPKTLPNFLWAALLDGNNLLQYFALATVETIFNTDFSLTYYSLWYWEDLQKLLDGPAQLLQRAAYDYDGVALLHSQASLHVSGLEEGPGRYEQAHHALLEALNGAWLQHYYVTDRHPEQLEAGRIKMLLLPCARALSPEVCRALRAYVEGGGVLVADVRPAVMDGSAARLGRSPLWEVFGVRMGAQPKPTPPAQPTLGGEYRWPGGLLRVPTLSLPAVVADAAVELADAQALGRVQDVPVLICHRFGKGLAVLLNFGVEGLGPTALTPLLRALAEAAGVRPAAAILGPDGRPLADCRLARFRYGNITIHGILLGNSHTKPLTCTFRLAQPAHLYNSLTGKYLGATGSAKIELTPAHGGLLCALPGPVDAVRVRAPATVRAGQDAPVEISLVGLGAQGPHLVRLHLLGPDGRRRRWYDRTVLAQDGQAKLSVPFAYNDPNGPWTIEAHEVASGVSSAVKVKVQESGP